jgi:uncharacterized protein
MSRIYWDSMLFIYLVEKNSTFGPRVMQILARMDQRGDRLYTSMFTFGEVLVGARKHKWTQIEDEIRILFLNSNSAITLLPFTVDVADRYATIRATIRIDPPDAIHLATAAVEGVDMFLTNDRSLARKTVPGIGFISDLTTAPL